jgi:NAD(P)-dependent dehydrogenase (short-subunit alcohol dehydrogenase family)
MGSQRNDLRGRVAVVTGSTRGLGFAMARLLGRQGATGVLASRSDADVAAAVERLHAEGIAVSGRRTPAPGPGSVGRGRVPVSDQDNHGDPRDA